MNLPKTPTLWPGEEECRRNPRMNFMEKLSSISTATAPTTPEHAERWFALKVFFNRMAPVVVPLQESGIEFFLPSGVVPSLLFVHCTLQEVELIAAEHFGRLMVYRLAGTRIPAPIPDREMEVFRFVVTSGRQGLTLLGDDRPEYHLGDRVVVTDGPFKGAEGHIKRIKKDRRLVVTIPGVVAVATAYIHPSMLKKVVEEE